MKEKIKINGYFIYIVNKFINFKNQIYTKLIFHRSDIRIQYPAKLNGLKYITIGKNFIAGKHLRLETIYRYGDKIYNPKIIIKNNVCINDFVHIGCTNYIEIGNNVLIASKVYISDHSHGYYTGNNHSSPLIEPSKRLINNDKKIIIGDNVWIGENVSILPGIEIGTGSIIGANTVVTKNIPKYSIVVGNPGKVIKKYNFLINKWENVL